jgi:hypothetical protein
VGNAREDFRFEKLIFKLLPQAGPAVARLTFDIGLS